MSIKLKFGDDARKEIFKGMEKMAKAVASSMGPAGRNTISENGDYDIQFTKDGASIARAVSTGLIGRYENIGATLLKKASVRTEEKAGDGTTAATLFGYEMAKHGMKYMDHGANVIQIRNGMKKGMEKAIEYIESVSTPADRKEDWKRIANISCQDEDIAEIIAEAVGKVGAEKNITVEEGDDWEEHETVLEFKKGIHFHRGFAHYECMTNGTERISKLENVHILVTDIVLKTTEHTQAVDNVMKELITEHKTSNLVIIARGFQDNFLRWMVGNNHAINFNQKDKSGKNIGAKVLGIKSPGYGDSMREHFCGDISVITGATLMTESTMIGIDSLQYSHLGKAEVVESTEDETLIVNNKVDKDEIGMRIAEIDICIDKAKGDMDKKMHRKRKSSLTDGIAVITVGGYVDTNIQELKDRVDDAVLATQCAYETGYVPGGGVTYLHAIEHVKQLLDETENDDEKLGVKIILKALEAPCKKIVDNAGESGEAIVRELKKSDNNVGYNVSKGFDEQVDLIEEGIIDPTQVLVSALRYGTEIATTFLTTDVIVVNVPVDNDNKMMLEGFNKES